MAVVLLHILFALMALLVGSNVSALIPEFIQTHESIGIIIYLVYICFPSTVLF